MVTKTTIPKKYQYCPDDKTKLKNVVMKDKNHKPVAEVMYCSKCDRIFWTKRDFTIGATRKPYP